MARKPLKGPSDPVNITNFSTLTSYLRDLRGVVFTIWTGHIECVTEVTLRASQTTTVLTDQRISSQSAITLIPLHADALTALASAYIAEAGYTTGQATITHASNASVNQKFRVTIIG